MVKRRVGIIAFFLCLYLSLMPCHAQAASTADAKEMILPWRECDLTISYLFDGTTFSDVPVKLYKIATVSADFQYTLTSPFESSGLILNGVQTVGEWKVIRSTLEAHILANGIEPDAISVTDQNGCAVFEDLNTGLYLAIVGEATQWNYKCYFDSALVSLPGLDSNGYWQYHIGVTAKAELLSPREPDEEMQFKVLKLWKGDEKGSDRPKSVEVEIFCNGESRETIILSEDNNWSYTWTAKADGASWKVVERNIPAGYVMTVEEREGAFVLTNTLSSINPDTPINPPQTGDTSNILLYIILMIVSGCVLVALGITGKRNAYEKAR